MRSILSNKYLLLLIRIFLAFIFIYAGVQKISNPSDFSQAIANYKLLPIGLVNIFALGLPWIEVISGILLLFGILVKENSFIISLLLAVFIGAIIISLARGLDITCGCFGTINGSKIGVIKILENLGLFILGFNLVMFGSEFLSLKGKDKLPQTISS